MTGLICMQGGSEFTPACRPMDEAWLARVERRAICIAPLACAAGAEYRTAADNGARYLHDLGVDDVSMAPEPDVSLDGAVRAIVDAQVVFIPGGSPTRARQRIVGTAIAGALRAHIAAGGTVIGASAGAMVLADHMVLPGRTMQVRSGLGLVPDVLVLPHYGESRGLVLDEVIAQVSGIATILGLPSCGGVLYETGDEGAAPVALGTRTSWRITAGSDPAPITAASAAQR